MMGVNYITTKSEMSGVSRYEKEIRQRLLKDVKFNLIEYIPSQINLKGFSLISKAFNKFLRFPWQIKRKVKGENITHITSEDLAYLLNFLNLRNCIISCHDLIYWVYGKKRNSLYWQLNMAGLRKADRIITVSNFSKEEMRRYLGFPEDKIDVIPDAVDHNQYFLKRDKEILKKYNVPEDEKVILYVGSEQPRMNVPFLIESLAKLKEILPQVKLLKIGNPQWPGAREKLEKLIKELNLENDVLFLGYVAEDELPKWYNAADLLVYPCLYAGFGVPPLEAMACGTPVITSNMTSLPEVVGDAGIMVNLSNINELTKAMYEVLTNENLKENLIKKGLERAKMFSWEKSAKETLRVYEKVATIQ